MRTIPVQPEINAPSTSPQKIEANQTNSQLSPVEVRLNQKDKLTQCSETRTASQGCRPGSRLIAKTSALTNRILAVLIVGRP